MTTFSCAAVDLTADSPLFFQRFTVFERDEFWHTSAVMPDMPQTALPAAPADAVTEPGPASAQPRVRPTPGPIVREVGGPPGPEPTRYGDWEKNGRCIDF